MQSPTLDFNRLEILSLLGRGAKGVVFLVRDKDDDRLLALKVILREAIEKKKKTKNNDEYKRVSFEQEVLSRFDHPLFPSLHGVSSTDKVIGYAIDYCPGKNLNSLRKMQSENMFSDEIIRFYAAELVLAFDYLHNQGIVYRDLKPDNVMIQENGHLMLVDFDLSTNLAPRTPQPSPSPSSETKSSPARRIKKRLFRFASFCNSGISPEEEESNSIRSSVSAAVSDSSRGEKSNSFVGTEEYVAPEVITGGGHDFAVDWWSLGIVLYEMLYGTTPFRGSNRKETFFRILTKPPNLIGETTSLRDLIRRLLDKDPSRRINVEEIKGHDFFRGVDWDKVTLVSRPPYIPAPDDGGDKGKDGNTKMDVEIIVQEIFAARKERDKQSDSNNNANLKLKNEKSGEWVKGLNNNNDLESDNNFLVF
ncbi:hypothetical protein EUTSA_v10002544mg [Eutrema salsugineum]|uniref:non-specific serine/threonine protein kinase n=1 Tax=Eutrema salsugineum TaxID=72664 RepID=V4KGZ1_EUTSA|nr:serine/threonine-protein kinase OXI1 [Eutrema salsugineum]ESQ37075.1 hypothetical protein EUTSA_v10002544mg [Eutrema salsugineum]